MSPKCPFLPDFGHWTLFPSSWVTIPLYSMCFQWLSITVFCTPPLAKGACMSQPRQSGSSLSGRCPLCWLPAVLGMWLQLSPKEQGSDFLRWLKLIYFCCCCCPSLGLIQLLVCASNQIFFWWVIFSTLPTK